MKNKEKEVDVQGLTSNCNEERYKCCICGGIFEGFGNNPSPYKNEGRCCDDCNLRFVIPCRIATNW